MVSENVPFIFEKVVMPIDLREDIKKLEEQLGSSWVFFKGQKEDRLKELRTLQDSSLRRFEVYKRFFAIAEKRGLTLTYCPISERLQIKGSGYEQNSIIEEPEFYKSPSGRQMTVLTFGFGSRAEKIRLFEVSDKEISQLHQLDISWNVSDSIRLQKYNPVKDPLKLHEYILDRLEETSFVDKSGKVVIRPHDFLERQLRNLFTDYTTVGDWYVWDEFIKEKSSKTLDSSLRLEIFNRSTGEFFYRGNAYCDGLWPYAIIEEKDGGRKKERVASPSPVSSGK